MGATRTQLRNSPGATVAWVLAIEGYQYLLTSWPTASAVVTAWSGTDWSLALSGLMPPGTVASRIQPFRPRLEHESMTFEVVPNEAETFAVDVFASELASGYITELTVELTSSATSCTVKSTGALASSGTIFIGTEAITYGGKTGTTFTSLTRGTWSPFAVDGGTRFGRRHHLTQRAGGITSRPYVTNYPRTWIGKWVALYAHAVHGSVLDTRADAELVWSGRIADVSGGNDGRVRLACTDAREAVASCILGQQLYTATVATGLNVPAGTTIRVSEMVTASGSQTSKEAMYTFGGGDGELAGGRYTGAEVIDSLNDWLADRINAADLDHDWSVTLRSDGQTQINIGFQDPGLCQAEVSTGSVVWHVLGWQTWPKKQLDNSDREDHTTLGTFRHLLLNIARLASTAPRLRFISDVPATVAVLPPLTEFVNGALFDIETEEVTGTWVNQLDDLPASIVARVGASAGEDWGLIDIGGRGIAVVRRSSDTYFDRVYIVRELQELLGLERVSANQELAIDPVYVRQVLLLQGDAAQIITRLFVSTGTAGYNHATYDDYAYGLGAAIPWDVLDDAFVNTVLTMFGVEAPQIAVLIDRPTRLNAILEPELALRNAHLVMRDGKLLFLTPSLTTSATATHTLAEANKGAPLGRQTENRSEWLITREYLVNHVKVAYNRTLGGEFRDVAELSNEQSKTDYGLAEPLTIEARNTLGGSSKTDDTIHDAIALLAAVALTRFARPLLVVTRSTNGSLYNAVAGDTCVITDAHVRDPGTGLAGITARSGWIVRHEFNWQTGTGVIEVAVVEDDRAAPYSPCADVDDTASTGGFTAGYNSSTNTLRCYANRYSLASETADARNFETGDLVIVEELSPTDPTNPTKWLRTVAAGGSGNAVPLTSALSSPSFDAALKYRIISQVRSSAQATQKTDCYLADDSDSLVESGRRPYVWITQPSETLSFDPPSTTRRHEFPIDNGDWETNGYPVHPGAHRAAIDTCNNLVSYRTAPNMPMLFSTEASSSSTDYVLVGAFWFYTGFGVWSGEWTRRLFIEPWLRTNDNSENETASMRVTSQELPPGGDTLSGIDAFTGAARSVTFTTTSKTYGNITAQALEAVRVLGTASYATFLTVEIKCSGGGKSALTFGLKRCYLGPLQ
jgi:hypothetical protein